MASNIKTVNLDQKELSKAIGTFLHYEAVNRSTVLDPHKANYESLNWKHRIILTSARYPSKLDMVENAIVANASLATAIGKYGVVAFLQAGLPHHVMSEADHPIAQATIRQLFRDWSNEGLSERETAFDAIKSALADVQVEEHVGASDMRILVPGAGLCRLPYELCKEGYVVEANEVSHHQFLATQFMINTNKTYEVLPWALSFSNHVKVEDQFASFLVPDVHSNDKLNLTINLGDFVKEYSKAKYARSFDAVVTMFFIDTAPNFLAYADVIRHCLKPRGRWINVGPLLWNCYENGPAGRGEGDQDHDQAFKLGRQINSSAQVELAADEMMYVLRASRFKTPGARIIGEAGYVADEKSLLRYSYRLCHWIAKKD